MLKKTLCFSNSARLSLRLGQLVIENDQGVTTRPIEDIGVVVLESGLINITSALISTLIENNVAVITCDSKHMPNGLLLPLNGNSVQQERFDAQVIASLPLKKQLWQQTIVAKLRNQAAVLEMRGIEAGNIKSWSNRVRSGDPDNFEARAAAYYWANIFPEIDAFIRGRTEDSPNELLNYGYIVLRAVIARSLVGSGLLPTLGIHHCNRYNAYCLADDIMEPYRPYVDILVLSILDSGEYNGEIDREIKRVLLTIPTLDVKIAGLNRPLMVAASMTTASLAKCFLGDIKRVVYPEINA
ncbi:MAG: type II CRISPR-associated endonuclease Cas1 [Paramuribaculum sp.]|nr:type II CRISPR-associated endonuclease Cas1 [Paramuribaculum sp.]